MSTKWPNQSLESTRVGKPPLAAQLQRWAAWMQTAELGWPRVVVT